MRRVGLIAAAVLGAAAALAAAVALAGSGDQSARVEWTGAPRVFAPKLLPRDRILSARVRNASLRDVEIYAADVRLLDVHGRPVRSAVRFLQTYVHGRYSPTQRPRTPNRTEQRQLGELAVLRPTETAPLTLSWRVPPGGSPPVRVDLGVASLPLR